jgi:hypothetical protein
MPTPVPARGWVEVVLLDTGVCLRVDGHMLRWVCCVAVPLLSACFHPDYDHLACGPGGGCPSGLACSPQGFCERLGEGGSVDAGPTMGDDAGSIQCVGTAFSICAFIETAPVTLVSRTIDTSSDASCASYSSTRPLDACVIVGASIEIPAGTTVVATGAKPLVLLATGSITITGTLDAASHHGATAGPAAGAQPCEADYTPASTTNGGWDTGAFGGGGWGGSFGARGGDGGTSGSVSVGGMSPSTTTVATLRGGCSGGDGAATPGTSGNGGLGGGAVLLVARQNLTIDGVVNASGAGGGGSVSVSPVVGGGGGGGAGGMIILDAATVNTSGQCFANGGGGGEGANFEMSGATVDGNPGGESIGPSIAAAGGIHTVPTGTGGPGGIATAAVGAAGVNGALQTLVILGQAKTFAVGTGGGGGGGVGVIKVFAAQQINTADPTKVSPLPSL